MRKIGKRPKSYPQKQLDYSIMQCCWRFIVGSLWSTSCNITGLFTMLPFHPYPGDSTTWPPRATIVLRWPNVTPKI